MLHIILLILKILGILLLVLLGIILAVLVLVLFVPIRYRMQGEYEKSPRGRAAVSWLFHLLSVRFVYDGQASLTVKVLGFRLFKEQGSRGDVDLDFEAGEDELVHMAEIGEGEVLVDEEEYAPRKPEIQSEPVGYDGSPKHTEAPKHTESGTFKKPVNGTAGGKQENTSEIPLPKGRLNRLAERLCCLLQKIKTWIVNRFKNIAGSISAMSGRVAGLAKQYEKTRAFLENEENQKTFRLLLRQTKKFLVHLFSGKIKGRVRFGFDDPYYTGQVLTAVSPFYGFYAKSVSLEPVFDEAVLEGELEVKGRIRLATLIFIGLRMLANKNFRVLLKKWRG